MICDLSFRDSSGEVRGEVSGCRGENSLGGAIRSLAQLNLINHWELSEPKPDGS